MSISANDPTLVHYERIADLSGQMLKLAQNQDWQAVIALSQQYQQAVESLGNPQVPPIDRPARQRLLEKILRDDASLRDLAMPELNRLSGLMGNLKRQQSLHQAYGVHQVP